PVRREPDRAGPARPAQTGGRRRARPVGDHLCERERKTGSARRPRGGEQIPGAQQSALLPDAAAGRGQVAAEHRREGGPGGVRGGEPGMPGASARLDALGQADAAAENGTEEQQMTTVRYSFSLARLSPARVSPGPAALLLSAWVLSACGSSPPVQEAASQSTFTPLRVGIYMDPLAPNDESVAKQLG